jgi:hypothetical protein
MSSASASAERGHADDDAFRVGAPNGGRVSGDGSAERTRRANARKRFALSLAVGLSIAGAPRAARADDNEACANAYDQVQVLRRGSKLGAAREQAAICLRDACPAFVRTDCGKWIGEIDAEQPTVVIVVHDGAGAEITAARVTLDGKPWLERLDGAAKPIDPGEHKLRFEAAAGASDLGVQIHAGEKNRTVSVTIGAPLPVTPPTLTSPPVKPPPVKQAPRSRSIAPWIVGGLGVASLGVGAVLGALVLGDKSTVNQECHQLTVWTCSQTGADATSSGKTLGPVSTITLVAGGVGIGVAAVWLIARAPADTSTATTVGTGPLVIPAGAGWTVRGSF